MLQLAKLECGDLQSCSCNLQNCSAEVNKRLAVVASQSRSVAQSNKLLKKRSFFQLQKRSLLAREIMEQKLDQVITAVPALTERLAFSNPRKEA